MPSKRPPTILDIAQAAGVSKSTVSLALRNSPLTKTETRERIQRLAKEMGYCPNMLFSIMGSGNRRDDSPTDRVAIAYCYDVSENRAEQLNLEMLEKMAAQHGFSVEVHDLAKTQLSDGLPEVLYHRGVAGVIIGSVEAEDSIAYRLDLSPFSVVCQGGVFRGQGYNRVREDLFNGIRNAWQRLHDAGYRRIGIAPFSHPQHFPDDQYRMGAALLCVSEAGEKDRIPPFAGDHRDLDGYVAWVKEWQPDAVIAFQSSHYWSLVDNGIRIPEDMGYVQMIINPEGSSRFICGYLNAWEPIVFHTLSLMNQLIRNRMRGMPEHPVSVLVSPEWNQGSTLRTVN